MSSIERIERRILSRACLKTLSSGGRVRRGAWPRGTDAGSSSIDSSDRLQLPPRWGLSILLGRLVEISGHGASAVLSAAMALVREAQTLAGPVAWITPAGQVFFPPDAAACGVDLETLLVVRTRAGPELVQAADIVLRSGGFDLVVLDQAAMSLADQTRCAGLARRHHTAVVCLTEKPADASSLGPLIALRADAARIRSDAGFGVRLRVIKDKRGAPGWQCEWACRAPAGLV